MSVKGIVIDIGGNTQKLSKALKDVNPTISNLKKELKEVNSGLKFDPKNTELLAQKQLILQKAIEQTSNKLKILKSAEENALKQLEKKEISENQFRSLRREIISAESQLKKLTKELNEGFGDKTEKNIEDVSEEIEDIGEESEKAEKKVKDLKGSLKSVGGGLNDVAKDLTKYVTAPIIAAAAASVKTAADFDSAMSEVAAISGATGDDLQSLRDKAREMGETTAKSASEAASALKYMSLAGWDTSQQIAGIEPILNASIASGGDLATVSDLVTDSMSALGVVVDDLGGYLDIVTQAQNNSNTSMQDLLTSYISVGGTLKNLNVPLEESSTLLGILANRGIKGAEAGKALNSLLVNLIGASSTAKTALNELNVSAWNATDGSFKGITTTLNELSLALSNCTDEQKALFEAAIGGKTQMDTLQALLSGIGEEYDSLKSKIEDADGALEATAIIMNDNLAGDFKLLQSELESVGISIGELVTPQVRKLLKEVSSILKGFNDLDLRTKTVITRFALLATAIGPTILALGTATKLAGTFITTITTLKTAIQGATTAQAIFNAVCEANPYVLAASLIAALAVAVGIYINSIDEADIDQEAFNNRISEMTDKLNDAREAYDRNKEAIEDNVLAEEAKLANCERLIPRLEELSEKSNRTAEEDDELNRIIKKLNESMPNLGLAIDNETGLLNKNTDAVRDNIAAYKDLARAKGAEELLQSSTKEKLVLEKRLEDSGVKDEREQLIEDINSLESEKAKYDSLIKEAKANDIAGDEIKYYADYADIINDIEKKKEQLQKLNIVYNDYVSQIGKVNEDIEYYSKIGEEYSKNANKFRASEESTAAIGTNVVSEAVATSDKAVSNSEKNIQKEREAAIKEELSILDFRREQGELKEEEYYNALKKIRDNNYEIMSDDWRNITQKMAKIQADSYKGGLEEQEAASKNYIERMNNADTWGEDSAEKAYSRIVELYKVALNDIDNVAWDSTKKREEYEQYLTEKIEQYTDLQKKAYVDEYKTRYDMSTDWISERSFYGDWNDYNDNEVDAWKRVKEYTDAAYSAGQLSYKEYAKQIKSIDRSIYSASKTMAEDMVNKIKDSEKAKLDAVKERVNKEKELLQDKYSEEDRAEKLAKLREQAKFYNPSLTIEGQEKYEEAIKGIREIEREISLENAANKGDIEITAAEQRYNDAVSNSENLVKLFQQKLIDESATAVQQQIQQYIDAQEDAEKVAQNEADTIMGIGENLASGITNIFKNYKEEQQAYINDCILQVNRFKNIAAGIFSGFQAIAAKEQLGTGSINNSKTYNYNHYGDYKFSNKQEMDIYNKEANNSLLNVFGA